MQVKVLMLSIALLLGGCSGPNTPQENVADGKAAAADGRYAEAVILYKNALVDDPSFAPARFELGVVYSGQGDLPAAERFLQDAIDEGFAPEQVVPLLASVYFQQNKVLALERLLKAHKNTGNSPAFNLQLALFKVLLLSRTEQIDAGQQMLNALGPAAQSCELCLLTQAHLQSYASPSAALLTLDTLLGQHPNNAQAYLLRGQLYFALHNPRQASVNFKQFQGLQPRAGYVQLLLAVSALQMNDRATAGTYIDTLLLSNPRQPLVNHIKALLVFELGDYKAAQQYAEQSIGRGLKSAANFLVAGISAYHQDQTEVAYGYLQKAQVYYPDNAQLQHFLMLIQLKFGNLEEVRQQYLKQDLRSVQDVLFGNVMAYQFIQGGQFNEADSVLAYLADTPVSQPAIRLQTQALQAQLKPAKDLALTELTDQASNPDSLARLVPIMLLLEANALAEAQQQAQQWLKQAPDNIDALNVLAYVFQQSDQPEKAQALYKKALIIEPHNTPSLFFMAQLAVSQSDNVQAALLYQAILQVNPHNLAALKAILRLTFSTQTAPDWDHLLRSLDLSDVTDDQLVAIADTMFQWHNNGRLDSLLVKYKPRSEWSDTVWMLWLKNRFQLGSAESFEDDFNTFYQQNALLDHLLFALSIVEKQGEFALQLQLIDALPEPSRSAGAVQMVQAIALLELNRDAQAEEILSSLEKPEVTSAAHWYVQGRLMENRGDLAQAANYLTAYYKALPNFNSVTSLARVLIKAGRIEDVASLAGEYREDYPNDDSAGLSLALKLAPSHPGMALDMLQSEHMQWLIERNWKLSNNVAWLYLSQQAPDKAILYSSNALALKPNDAQVRRVHANTLIALQRPGEAREVLQGIAHPDIDTKALILKLSEKT